MDNIRTKEHERHILYQHEKSAFAEHAWKMEHRISLKDTRVLVRTNRYYNVKGGSSDSAIHKQREQNKQVNRVPEPAICNTPEPVNLNIELANLDN